MGDATFSMIGRIYFWQVVEICFHFLKRNIAIVHHAFAALAAGSGKPAARY